jgi:transcriptional regulator with XRE-family HTH domain
MNEPGHDWYLREWLTARGKRQASLTNELGWSKNKANKIWHSRQAYGREVVNEVAAWLGVPAYELLMPPHEAVALRQLRQAAHQIASGEDITLPDGQTRRTGTEG